MKQLELEFKADLHMHSTFSDGSFAPFDLFKLAKEIGLAGIAITDHDSIEAYTSALDAAKAFEVKLGTGVELSCYLDQSSVHILGYDFSLTSGGIRDLCDRHKKRRADRNSKILEKLRRHNVVISEDELLRVGSYKSLGRPHIAQVMVEKGYASSIKEVFIRFLGEGRSCYVPGEPFRIEEAIETIHEVGGKAFIAHPHFLKARGLLNSVLKHPFDGIECYYSRFDAHHSKRWLNLAESEGLLVSGGSDFHGSIKPEIKMGCSYVGQSDFSKIFQNCLN